MATPTFLCIGAPKAGTTWLAANVRPHPEVCSGREKELHFFDKSDRYVRGLEWYEAQFVFNVNAQLPTAVGELTPDYLMTVGEGLLGENWLGSAERVAAAYPDVRLIALLRDPVERAVSGYYHNIRKGRISPRVSFSEALRRNPSLVERGRYDIHLDRWFDLFPRNAFLLLVYEEDVKPDDAKPQTLRRVFEHIGVDSSFVSGALTDRRNTRASHFQMRLRHAPPLVAKAMRKLPIAVKSWPLWDIPVSDADKAALAAEYAPGIERLETLLGRTLPWPGAKQVAASAYRPPSATP